MNVVHALELLSGEAGGCRDLDECEAHESMTAMRDARSRRGAGQMLSILPLVNPIACCLYGAGHTDDMNQVKAIVAIETGNLAAA